MMTVTRQCVSVRFHSMFGQRFFRFALCAVTTAALCLAALCNAQSSAQSPRSALVAAPATTVAGPAQSRAQAATQAARRGGGQHEGIKVHGHWKIDVRNPDGTLVSHREFENSLQTAGQSGLADTLSGTYSVGDWSVELDEANLQGNPEAAEPESPCTKDGNPAACDIVEAGDVSSTACIESLFECFNNLQVPSPAQSGSLSLTGTAIASANGVIDEVQTGLNLCAPSVAPSVCATTTSDRQQLLDPFSEATLPAQGSGQCGGTGQISCAVPVSAGQTINVSVTYSFQ